MFGVSGMRVVTRERFHLIIKMVFADAGSYSLMDCDCSLSIAQD